MFNTNILIEAKNSLFLIFYIPGNYKVKNQRFYSRVKFFNILIDIPYNNLWTSTRQAMSCNQHTVSLITIVKNKNKTNNKIITNEGKRTLSLLSTPPSYRQPSSPRKQNYLCHPTAMKP